MVYTEVNENAGKPNENDAVRGKHEKVEPEPLIIADMDSAQEFASKLISKHHHELASANIIFLCRSKAAKRGGAPVPGHVKKASPTDRHISRAYFSKESADSAEGEVQEADFIVTVALDVWNMLMPNQRTALMDHLLSHCQGEEDKNGKMKWKVRPPQVQEFPEVAERNGRWNDGLIELGNCLKGK